MKILQDNDRIAEVQFICDLCGKLVKTSMIPRRDLDAQKNIAVICWQCKQAKLASEKS